MFREILFEFPTAVRHDPAVEDWFNARGDLGVIARRWFDVMRDQGEEVRELLHDHHPTACVGAIAFGYPFLTTWFQYISLPIIGELPLASALLFDAGIFVLVVGTTALILIAIAHQSVRTTIRSRAPNKAELEAGAV